MDKNKPKFVYVTHINTTPEKVWQALTTAEFTQRYWMGQRVQSDWKAGAPVSFAKPDGTVKHIGEVLRFEPPKILSYSWSGKGCHSDVATEPATRVTFEIAADAGITTLTVTHDGFEPGSKIFGDISGGWPIVLSGLKTLLETNKSLPFEGNR
jgi:uncharacterized protein YndB with AHSA1/START domain